MVRGGSEPWSVVICVRWAPRWQVICALPSCRGWHLFLLLFFLVCCAARHSVICTRCWLLWNTKRGETPVRQTGQPKEKLHESQSRLTADVLPVDTGSGKKVIPFRRDRKSPLAAPPAPLFSPGRRPHQDCAAASRVIVIVRLGI